MGTDKSGRNEEELGINGQITDHNAEVHVYRMIMVLAVPDSYTIGTWIVGFSSHL